MATLYITEFVRFGRDSAGTINQPEEPPIAQQTVAVTAGSVQSAALNPSTRLVRVQSDAICSIAVGTNPIATSTTRRMAAGATELLGIPTVGAYRVAVITNT